LRGRPLRRRMIGAGVLAALLGTAVLVDNRDRVLAWLGRDASLSGRTALWAQALEMSAGRPWIGHGYATFWPRAQAAAARVSPRRGWPMRHPHNGFLEVLCELGLIGIAGLLVPFALLLRRALALSVAPRARYWPLAYLSFLALSNLTESDFLRHKIFWALYVALAVDLFGRARGPAAAHAQRDR
jgi:exopolysaccharide production protein ExoQ